MYFLGYPGHHNGYICHDLVLKKNIIYRHVVFSDDFLLNKLLEVDNTAVHANIGVGFPMLDSYVHIISPTVCTE